MVKKISNQELAEIINNWIKRLDEEDDMVSEEMMGFYLSLKYKHIEVGE